MKSDLGWNAAIWYEYYILKCQNNVGKLWVFKWKEKLGKTGTFKIYHSILFLLTDSRGSKQQLWEIFNTTKTICVPLVFKMAEPISFF